MTTWKTLPVVLMLTALRRMAANVIMCKISAQWLTEAWRWDSPNPGYYFFFPPNSVPGVSRKRLRSHGEGPPGVHNSTSHQSSRLLIIFSITSGKTKVVRSFIVFLSPSDKGTK